MEPTPDRITLRRIAEELLEIINLERGLGYTIRELAVRPGQAIRVYLFEDRKRMVKPFAFLVLTVTIATFLSLRFLPLGEELWPAIEADLKVAKTSEQIITLLKWFFTISRQYFNLVFVSSLPGLAIATYLLFREKGYNLAEHLVINTYIFSFQTLLYTAVVPFIVQREWVGILLSLLMVSYILFAFTRVFQQPFWRVVGKSILAYMISQAITSFLLLLIGLFAWIWLSL